MALGLTCSNLSLTGLWLAYEMTYCLQAFPMPRPR